VNGGRPVYSVYAYGTMIQPGPRVDAYLAAMRAAIRPGMTVMDLGSGPGYFAAIACHLGAKRVYAVEPDASITVAREIAAASGCAQRIEFVQEASQKLTLSHKVDVIVSDLRGVTPLFQNHIPSIIDARERLLAPGGKLIPLRDTLWAAPVQDAKLYESYEQPWAPRDGVDLRPGRRLAVNTWRKAKIEAACLLGGATCWGELDYRSISASHVAGRAEWHAARDGICHGFALWFDADLGFGASFSNAPGRAELVYGQAFLPLEEPVTVAHGQAIRVDLQARLIGEDYVWTWDSELLDLVGKPCRFKQSSFHSAPLSVATLDKRELSSRPTLGEEGELVLTVLARMKGNLSLDQIAKELVMAYPQRFAAFSDAQRFVSELAVKYSR
jgi:protein arginine N-methyltransferase 1